MKYATIVLASIVFVLAACQPRPVAPGDPVPAASPLEVAASVAQVALDAAIEEALRQGSTRQSIVDAGLAAATEQAMLVAPSVIGDPTWAAAIRTAISLAIVMSKSDGASVFVVNREKGESGCKSATEAALSRSTAIR